MIAFEARAVGQGSLSPQQGLTGCAAAFTTPPCAPRVEAPPIGPVPGPGSPLARVSAPREQQQAPEDVDLSGDAVELSALLQQFRRRLEDPLLPLPDPTVVCRRLFSVSWPIRWPIRRSKRIAAKGKGLTSSKVKRAQRLLMVKLGIGDCLVELPPWWYLVGLP
jgi:hypothetical protein